METLLSIAARSCVHVSVAMKKKLTLTHRFNIELFAPWSRFIAALLHPSVCGENAKGESIR